MLGLLQDFDACVFYWALRWLQSLPGSAADCARMHASKQGMRDESTRRSGLGFQQDFALRTASVGITGGSRVCLGRLQIVGATQASKQGMRDESTRRAGNVREGWARVSARFWATD